MLCGALLCRGVRGPGAPLVVRCLGTSPRLGLKKSEANIFNTKATQKVIESDGHGADFSLIFIEPSNFKSHRNFTVCSLAATLGLYYLAQSAWPTSLLFGTFIGPTVLLFYTAVLGGYSGRLYYRTPRRLYYNTRTGGYRVLLNRQVPHFKPLPWTKPLVVDFDQDNIVQLDVEAAGWKGHGITRFQLSPVDRLLVLDKAAFSSSSSYWTLCGRKEN